VHVEKKKRKIIEIARSSSAPATVSITSTAAATIPAVRRWSAASSRTWCGSREKENEEVTAPLMLVTSPAMLLAGHGGGDGSGMDRRWWRRRWLCSSGWFCVGEERIFGFEEEPNFLMFEELGSAHFYSHTPFFKSMHPFIWLDCCVCFLNLICSSHLSVLHRMHHHLFQFLCWTSLFSSRTSIFC